MNLPAPGALAPTDIDFLRKLVQDRSGIVLGADKGYLFTSRLVPVAKAANIASLALLVTQLRQAPSGPLSRQVIEAMTTNETFFFRDIAPFEALRQHILPAVIERRKAERRISMWCAAASTGQEPYTVALVLRQHFPETAGWDIAFHATDISAEVLKKARAGRYHQIEVDRGMPPAQRARWFTQDGDAWVVREELRRMVTFRELNLLEAWPFSQPFDIIMIRNVLIYFDVATKRTILGRCRKLLHPQGHLFLGSAETTMGIDDAFERLPYDKAGVYRLRG